MMGYKSWFDTHADKHKKIVEKLTASGKTKEQIVEYFEFENNSVLYVSDQNGNYSEGLIIGNPEDFRPSKNNSLNLNYSSNVEVLSKSSISPDNYWIFTN